MFNLDINQRANGDVQVFGTFQAIKYLAQQQNLKTEQRKKNKVNN